MKTIFRFFSLAALVVGIAAGSAMAQDVCTEQAATDQYNKFLEGYKVKGNDKAHVQDMVNTGKAFLEKYGACADWTEQVKFVKGQTTRLEKQIGVIENDVLFANFDKAINSDNVDELYPAGKAILAKDAENINIMYVLGVAGLTGLDKKNEKYTAESLRYAQSALAKLKSGASTGRKLKDGKDSVGALKYERAKEDAISELEFAIGWLNYYGTKDKKAALPALYNVTQTAGARKSFAPVYSTIGDYYIAEANPIADEIKKMFDAITKKVEDAKKATTPEDIAKFEAELKADDVAIKAKEALFNGYLERAMDAYGRAWNVAKADNPAAQKYKDGLMNTINTLYKRRFDKDTGATQWVATATAKPFPNPTSAVEPVTDAVTTTSGGGVGAANGTGVGAANGTGVGAANGTGVGAASGKTVGTPASASKAVAAKPKPRR